MATAGQAETLSLRVSVTQACQLRCAYCAPAEGFAELAARDTLGIGEILAFVRFARSHFDLRKVHLTGGEPLLRQDVVDLVRRLAADGLADLALTTNGHRLPEMADDLRAAGLRRVNISLDSLHPETYRRLTRGGDLARALMGIDAARRAGLDPVKLNMVVLRGVNDGEAAEVVRFGLDLGCQVRLLELMPIGVAKDRYDAEFVSSAEVRERLAREFSLRPLAAEHGASSRNFLARDDAGREGTVGFISPCSDAFCGHCRRLRLTADGRLLGCLAQPDGPAVRDLLREDAPDREARLLAAVMAALGSKRDGRRFADQRPMISVGG